MSARFAQKNSVSKKNPFFMLTGIKKKSLNSRVGRREAFYTNNNYDFFVFTLSQTPFFFLVCLSFCLCLFLGSATSFCEPFSAIFVIETIFNGSPYALYVKQSLVDLIHRLSVLTDPQAHELIGTRMFF